MNIKIIALKFLQTARGDIPHKYSQKLCYCFASAVFVLRIYNYRELHESSVNNKCFLNYCDILAGKRSQHLTSAGSDCNTRIRYECMFMRANGTFSIPEGKVVYYIIIQLLH